MASYLRLLRQGSSALATIAFGLSLCVSAAGASAAPLIPEAGYSLVEQITFKLRKETEHLDFTSSRAEIFYNFHPADPDANQNPATRPLFVFFNGGPGCPTCEGLLSTNTGPRSMHPEPWGPTPKQAATSLNAYSWTRMGHLLYIDAPATGYSYNLSPTDFDYTFGFYDAQNFNPYIDAAQLVRVLLRFLNAHPDIRNNPVVLVGESYGGTRVTTMLNLLLNYRRYGDGSDDIYVDPQLSKEVQTFLDQRHQKPKGSVYAPSFIARQFGRQILIQPQLTGANQSQVTGDLYEEANSPIDKLASRKGMIFERCPLAPRPEDPPCDKAENAIRFVMFTLDISPYHTRRTLKNQGADGADSELGVTMWTWARLFTTKPVRELLDYEVTWIDGLYINNRYAFDYDGHSWFPYNVKTEPYPKGDAEPGALPGTERPWIEAMPQALEEAWAQYQASTDPDPTLGWLFPQVFGLGLAPIYNFVSCPPLGVYNAFYTNSATAMNYDITPQSNRYGALFLENLPFVKTMITNAGLDVMVYTPALPPSLRSYPELVKSVDVQYDSAGTGDATIRIQYQTFSFAKLRSIFPRGQTIWFPTYPEAGHAVSAGMPAKLLNDVTAWMAGTKP